ncbi:MAG TPA: tetratricopeptide repeat protein [Candidatus Babeliaceae bacterium]|nr:tetratricopeptide repeat protein [Candidatus Babeliaceae bacterium]
MMTRKLYRWLLETDVDGVERKSGHGHIDNFDPKLRANSKAWYNASFSIWPLAIILGKQLNIPWPIVLELYMRPLTDQKSNCNFSDNGKTILQRINPRIPPELSLYTPELYSKLFLCPDGFSTGINIEQCWDASCGIVRFRLKREAIFQLMILKARFPRKNIAINDIQKFEEVFVCTKLIKFKNKKRDFKDINSIIFSLFENPKSSGALSALYKILEQFPGNPQASFWLATALFHINDDTREAQKILEVSFKHFPSDARCLMLLYQILWYKDQNPVSGIKYLDRAIAIASDWPLVLIAKIVLLIHINNFEEAYLYCNILQSLRNRRRLPFLLENRYEALYVTGTALPIKILTKELWRLLYRKKKYTEWLAKEG